MTRNRTDLAIRLLGTAVGVVGVLILLWAGRGVIRSIVFSWAGLIELGITLVLMAVPFAFAGLCIYVAVLVWRRPLTVQRIDEVTALAAWIVFGLLMTSLMSVLDFWWPEPGGLTFGVPTFVSALLAGVLREVVRRKLIVRCSFAPQVPPRVSDNTVVLVCVCMWIALSESIEAFKPSHMPGDHNPWFLLTHFLGPIVFAILICKIAIHYTHGLPGLPFIGPWLHARKQLRLNEQQRARVSQFRCPMCDYDVRQTLADARTHCPECGFELALVKYPVLPQAAATEHAAATSR